MRTKVFIVLAVLLAIPCFSKVSVREYALPAVQGFPYKQVISDNWILALLNTTSNDATSTIGVIAYDCTAKKIYTIHKGKVAWPAITGTIAMWSGKSDDVEYLRGTKGKYGQYAGLVFYDLSTNRYWSPNLGSVSAYAISASGNYVVYEAVGRVYLFNLANGEVKRISGSDPNCRYPDVEGDLAIWRQFDPKQNVSRICGYCISTGETVSIIDDYEFRITACTDGKYVIWANNAGVYCYNVQTQNNRFIKSASFPDVGNGFVVYTRDVCACTKDYKGSKRMVYGMDLKTGQEFQISKDKTERSPSITGSRVAWPEGGVLHYADLERVETKCIAK